MADQKRFDKLIIEDINNRLLQKHFYNWKKEGLSAEDAKVEDDYQAAV